MGSLEKRYAEALLSLTENAAQADQVGLGLNALGRLFMQNAELRGFILNPVISRKVRGETLQGVLEILGFAKSGGKAQALVAVAGIDIKADAAVDAEVNTGVDVETEAYAEADVGAGVGAAAEADGSDGDGDADADAAAEAYAEADATAPDKYDAAPDKYDVAPVLDSGDLLSRFLRLLLDKGRLAFLPNIAEEYQSIKAKTRDMLQVTVRSSLPLEPDILEEIREKYRLQYGAAAAEVKNIVEPSLIGGVSVQIGDIRIDDTIYGRLAGLARTIAAGAVKQAAEAG